MNQYLTIRDLAARVGRDRSAVLKRLKKARIPTVKVRGVDTGHQLARAILRRDFDRVAALFPHALALVSS